MLENTRRVDTLLIDNGNLTSGSALSDSAYDNDGKYQIDGTTCSVTVMRKGNEEHCGKPGRVKRCEFHHLLNRDSSIRRDCRINSGSGLVHPNRHRAYVPMLNAMVRALTHDNERQLGESDNVDQ